MSDVGASPAGEVDLGRAVKRPDAWWTVIVVDPLALRLLPFVVRRPGLTPDRLSIGSLVLALAAGVAFLNESYVLGAVLFELHFLLDCLDGKVARVRSLQNPRGGFVDLACDLVGTAWCFGTVGYAAFEGTSWAGLALAAATAHVVYTWSTLQRSKAGALVRSSAPRSGVAGRLAARGLVPTPYGVEVETVVLFLLPLLGRESVLRAALLGACGFYAVATARNLRATYRGLPAA